MLSEQLKILRKRDKLSQKALAEKLFVSQQAIAKWEKDSATPNPEMLAKISDVFQVSVDYLLGVSDKKNTPTSDDVSESPEAKHLREIVESLPPADQQRVLEFAKNLAATMPKQKPDK